MKLLIHPLKPGKHVPVPFFRTPVSAGFPSPAGDYIEEAISLDEEFILNQAATFIVRATGLSMIMAGIQPGDYLIVDKSRDPNNGNIVIAAVNREFMVKRYVVEGDRTKLVAENPDFEEIRFTENDQVEIWGVVTAWIHPAIPELQNIESEALRAKPKRKRR